MKIISASLLALSAVNVDAVHQQADIFYHEKQPLGATMWGFNADGLTIYSPNGDVLKKHRKSSLCTPYTDRYGNVNDNCSFFTMASDGHKYVWAAAHGGDHRIEVFDIDTGDYAGHQNSCNTPLDLSYHPARQEMWLRCAQSLDDTTGEIDVYSSGSLNTDRKTIDLQGTARPYGRFAVHSSMGPLAYATSYNMNWITELDLSDKTVKNTYEIPKAYGSYDMTYSPVNEHIFFRARVCCTCGSVDTDVESCGWGGAKEVIIQTGPGASANPQNGTCGNSCEGSAADTIGVVEFDTVSKSFVAEHNIKSGTGWGADPVASPDGEYILLLPNDGGQNIRLIKPAANGQASVVAKDIPVGFTGGTPGRSVVSDYAFVKDSSRDILVLASSKDNNVVLVDLKNNYKMRKIDLAPGAESTGGSSRKVEWAVGTNYVWINGGEAEEQYIIEIKGDIDSAKISRTLTGVKSGNMIFVNNYERLRSVQLMSAMVNNAQVDVSTGVVDKSTSTPSSSSSSSGSSNTIGTVGLAIGCVALAVGFAAVYIAMTSGGVTGSSEGQDRQEQFQEDPEAKTLGSKVVN